MYICIYICICICICICITYMQYNYYDKMQALSPAPPYSAGLSKIEWPAPP